MSNILIIKHGSLGDIAQAFGAIQDISENHKKDQIHLLTTKPYFDLFKKNPFINNVILDKNILINKIKSLKPKRGKEVHITDAIQLLINDKERFIAHNFEGKYLDCGSMNGYINSSKEIGKL